MAPRLRRLSYLRRRTNRDTRMQQNRPRILHLGFEDPQRPAAGGGSMRTHEISRRLANEFDITIVCARYRGCRQRVEDGVRYVHIGVPAGYFGSLISYFACIPWALWRYDSDLVVEEFSAPVSSIAVPWLTRRPVLGVVQWLFAAEKSKQYHMPFCLVERIGLSSHRRLIAVSEDLADELRVRNPAAVVSVIGNGLSETAFEPRSHPRRNIVYLGRMEIAQKGLDMLVTAYARIAPKIAQDLVFGGDGPDRGTLEQLVVDLGIIDRVHFAGWVSSVDRFDWLASADFVAMPSRNESFGLVAAEALAVQTPVVAFDIPSLRALVGDDVGIVVPPFDIDRYALAMYELAMDPARRARLGAAGPTKVMMLRWDTVAQRQGDIYREVIASRSTDPSPDAQNRSESLRSAPSTN